MGRGEVVVLGSGVKLSCLLHLHRKSLKTDNSSCNPVFMEISEKTTLNGSRTSPGYGKTGRMADTGQGGRFSLSERHSAIKDGRVLQLF